MKKKNGVYFNEGEIRDILIPNENISGKIFMPNELFSDLLTCDYFRSKHSRVKDKSGNINSYKKEANVSHYLAFAFSFVFLASYMYRYSRFTYNINQYEKVFIDEEMMYMILNTSPTSRGKEGVSYITKKGGVLEQLGYIRKESDYPISYYYEEIELNGFSFVEFKMYSDYIDVFPNGYVHPKPLKSKVNYPIKAFHYDEKKLPYDINGYFYDTQNTTGIDINVFIYCMSRKELGTVGFYLYCFIKSKCDYYKWKTGKSSDYTRKIEDLVCETGIGKTKLCEILISLESHNMITNTHRPFVLDLPIDKKIPANTYSINEYMNFHIREVKTRQVMSFEQYDKHCGIYLNCSENDIKDVVIDALPFK